MACVVSLCRLAARLLCERIGLNMVRSRTVGTHRGFVRMIRELIVERMTGSDDKCFLGARGASHDVCPLNCCLPGATRPVMAQANAAS